MRPRSETFVMALSTLRRNPGRSGLTLLGLAIGVGAFIAMVSFGEGARRSVMAQFKALGTHLLSVRGISRGGLTSKPITLEDVRAIRRDAPSVLSVSPIARMEFQLSRGGRSWWSRVQGTSAGFAVMHDWRVSSGGMFSERDSSERAKVCVVGQTPVRELFDDRSEDALGETLTIGRSLSCRVIGVLAPKGTSTSGQDIDDQVLIPVTTFVDYLGLLYSGYSGIEIEPRTPELVDQARLEVALALRRSHALAPAQADDFLISSPAEVIRAVERTSMILARLLQGIAAVSLFVGGIGIMNIQLVSVTERTAEIGIRAAIGASPRQILTQFLMEGALLSLLGALLGVLLGVGVSVGMAESMGWERVTSVRGIVLAAAFGVGVGLLFGFLPARRAALFDPIQALRRE